MKKTKPIIDERLTTALEKYIDGLQVNYYLHFSYKVNSVKEEVRVLREELEIAQFKNTLMKTLICLNLGVMAILLILIVTN